MFVISTLPEKPLTHVVAIGTLRVALGEVGAKS
jgi:hypothetical protein